MSELDLGDVGPVANPASEGFAIVRRDTAPSCGHEATVDPTSQTQSAGLDDLLEQLVEKPILQLDRRRRPPGQFVIEAQRLELADVFVFFLAS